MKGFKQRLRIFTVCFLLLCAWIIPASATALQNCTGNCSHQAAIGTTHYDTLAEAVAAARSGSTVTLLTDTFINTPITVEVPLTLDLGGRTLTADLLSHRRAAVQFLDDGSIRNGKIIVATGTALRVCGCSVNIEKDAALESIGTAPVLSVTADKDRVAQVTVAGQIRSDDTGTAIDVYSAEGSCEVTVLEDAKIIAAKESAIVFSGVGKLDICGGTVRSKKDTVLLTVSDEWETDISITGGKLISREGQVLTVIQEGSAALPKDFITGGTFRPVPTAYIPAYCELITNYDGTVTVSSTVSGTHTHTGGNATCARKAICKLCGASYGSYGSHNPVSVAELAPACDSIGMRAHSECSNCGSLFLNGVSVSAASLSVPALGHDWETVEETPATCETPGTRAHRVCKTCKAMQVEGKDASAEDLLIPAGSHRLEAVESTQATCKEAGVQAHELCSLCGERFVDGKPVTLAELSTAAEAHVLSEWQQDAQYHWKSCVDCEEIFRQSIHADKNNDALCDDCGYALLDEEATPPSTADDVSYLFLIPIFAAGATAVALLMKKKPARNQQ